MKFGKNDPCPCGSGKKYKKCCELKGMQNPVKDLARFIQDYETFIQKVGAGMEADDDIIGGYYQEFVGEDVERMQPVVLEMLGEPFMDWLFATRMEEGDTFSGRFMETDGATEADRAVGEALVNGIFSLHEVVAVKSDCLVTLKESFSGEIMDVFMPPDEEGYEAGEGVFGRVAHFGNIRIMTGIPGLTLSGIRPEAIAELRPEIVATAGSDTYASLKLAEPALREMMVDLYIQLFDTAGPEIPLFAYDESHVGDVLDVLRVHATEEGISAIEAAVAGDEIAVPLKDDMGVMTVKDNQIFFEEGEKEMEIVEEFVNAMEEKLGDWLVDIDLEEMEEDGDDSPTLH